MLDAGQNIITRQLPKTGQTTMYFPSDDGNLEAGWWKRRLNANNRTRFLARTIAGDDIVLDRATGLMWPRDFAGPGANNGNVSNWNAAIFFGFNLNFAGFDDWRLPNVQELFSLVNYETGPPYIWPPFVNVPGGRSDYWSSTTYPVITTSAMSVWFDVLRVTDLAKVDDHYIVAVRKGV